MTELINKECWERQRAFNLQHIDLDNLSIEQKQQLTKDFVLYILDETHEILREINWKSHRKSDKSVIETNIKEELIDVFKFYIGLCQVWNISTEELFVEFNRKSDVVEMRHRQEFLNDLKKMKTVCAFDLDGVLAVYPEHFLKFVNLSTGNNFDDINVTKKELGTVKYNILKDMYRQSGEKINIPLNENVSEVLYNLSKTYKIVLLSSRPYSKYYRIFSDTIEWTKKNNINPYISGILFDEEKDRKILQSIPKLNFLVEDNRTFANSVAAAGFKVYLLNNKYNEGEIVEGVTRIDNLLEVLGYEL